MGHRKGPIETFINLNLPWMRDMQAPKKTTTKVRRVKAQDMPEDHVPLSEFGEDNHLLKAGKINALKLAVGSRGLFYIDKNEGKEALKDKKGLSSSKDDQSPEIELLEEIRHEVILVRTMSGPVMDMVMKNTPIYNQNVDIILEEIKDINSKLDNQNVGFVREEIKDINSKLDNLCRHVCIQGTLLYGVIEELGVQNKVLNKKVVKERIKHLNRLITQEDWDDGFELSET